jgi:hypothetical protein
VHYLYKLWSYTLKFINQKFKWGKKEINTNVYVLEKLSRLQMPDFFENDIETNFNKIHLKN